MLTYNSNTHTSKIIPSKTCSGLLTWDKQRRKYLIWLIRCDIIFEFVNCLLCSSSYSKSLHGKVVLHCTLHQSCVCKCVSVCVCVLQRKMAFSSMAQFHLASPLLEWKYGSNGWKMFPPLLCKKGQAYTVWGTFHLLSYNRAELCPSMQYHLSLFSLSSGYHIRLSISTHPPLRRQALL